MDAYVSGQSALAVLVDGQSYHLLHSGDSIETQTVSRSMALHILRSCVDVELLTDVRHDQIRDALLESWKEDRALRLFLLILDNSEPDEERAEITAILNELLDSHSVKTAVLNRMCSSPLENTALPLAEPLPNHVSELVNHLLKLQDGIARAYQAWISLPEDLFESPLHRKKMTELAIEEGAFRQYAEVTPRSLEANLAILEFHKLLAGHTNAREIVKSWTTPLGVAKKVREKTIDEIYLDSDEEQSSSSSNGSRSLYENAQRQLQGVKDRLRQGDIVSAQRFATQLVSDQLAHNGREYAAKSLCNIAQTAKSLALYDLQLQWSLRASEIAPEDPLAHGHAADALIHFNRLDEALSALDLCEKFGKREFAMNGRARILRVQARLQEALEAFQEIIEQYAESEEILHSIYGAAETLREMGRLDDALRTYSEAISRFPSDVALRCGRAAVLTDIGRLEDALQNYDHIIATCGNDLVARNGRATVLRKMGRFAEAESAYDTVQREFPGDTVSKCGAAEVLRLKGDLISARDLYHGIRAAFPQNAVAHCGFADVLRDMGKISEAIEAYREFGALFPYESRFANGLAATHRELGQFEEALRLFDATAQKFPFDIVCRLNRANLLGKLKRSDHALAAYDEILNSHPGTRKALNGKAALLSFKEKYEEAWAILPEENPRTEDEWSTYVLRGMIMFRKGEIDRAKAYLMAGRQRTQFARSRNYLSNAIALIDINRGRFREAETILGGKLEPVMSTVANVLSFHIASAQNSKSRHELGKALINEKLPIIRELFDGISARYNNEGWHRPTNDWLEKRELEVILLDAA